MKADLRPAWPMGVALLLGACTGSPAGEGEVPRLFPGLLEQLNTASSVEVHRAGQEAITLHRDGDQWRWVARDWPADASRLRPLLLSLAQARCDAPRTSQPEKYARIGVEAIDSPGATSSQVRVTVGAATHALIVGREHAQGGSYVRVADEAQACLSKTRPPLAEAPADWLDTRLLTRSANTFTEVQVIDGRGAPLRLRPQGGRFAVVGVMPGNNSLPAGIAGAFTDFRLADVRAARDDVAVQRRIVFVGGDGVTLALQLWREDGAVWFRLLAEARADASASAQAFVAGIQQKAAGRDFLLPPQQIDAIMATPAALSAP